MLRSNFHNLLEQAPEFPAKEDTNDGYVGQEKSNIATKSLGRYTCEKMKIALSKAKSQIPPKSHNPRSVPLSYLQILRELTIVIAFVSNDAKQVSDTGEVVPTISTQVFQ